jgi:hypothetical protein
MLFALLLTATLDAGTTCAALSRGLMEANPIYGSHPTCGRVVGMKAAGTGGAVWLSSHLKPRPRKIVLAVLVGVNVSAVAWNIRQVQR